jgi:D-alanyl-D-alanine carboxypeptidase (penicillin-binding protein 5/6)
MNRYFSLFLPLLAACFLTVQAGTPASALAAKKTRQSVAVAKKKDKTEPSKRQAVTRSKKLKKHKHTAQNKTVSTRSRAAEPPIDPVAGISITSKSVIILDAHTGETLFAKAPDQPRQPASTLKVLTGLIALKRLKTEETVEVSPHAEQMPRSKIYLSSDRQYKADDLINAVLLESANDASVALAEKIAGSEPAFAQIMTLYARLVGAGSTVCRTASGLTADGQQSTARDLAQIFRHAMRNKDFAERMQLTKIRTSFGKLLRNHNKALWQVEGAVGGKTGFTSLARQTYVGQFRRGEDAIVVAIMGSETMWRDIKRLVDYGFQKKDEISKVARLERPQAAAEGRL